MATVSGVISSIKSFLSSKYLTLTGGLMTGTIQNNSGRTSSIIANTTGGQVWLFDASDTTYKGGFIVRARTADGSIKDLFGKNDGTLTWSGKPVVCVSKWTSGTSWYRIYSDGWIEQGGYTPRTSDAYVSVSFHTAFTTSNPNVQLTRRYYYDNDSTASQNRTTGVSSVTSTGFKCYDNGWSAAGGSCGVWVACGY